jgi:hypothetical protein
MPKPFIKQYRTPMKTKPKRTLFFVFAFGCDSVNCSACDAVSDAVTGGVFSNSLLSRIIAPSLLMNMVADICEILHSVLLLAVLLVTP